MYTSEPRRAVDSVITHIMTEMLTMSGKGDTTERFGETFARSRIRNDGIKAATTLQWPYHAHLRPLCRRVPRW